MYEQPKLNRVGDAQDVILGTIPMIGNDLDTQWSVPAGGFTDDPDASEIDF